MRALLVRPLLASPIRGTGEAICCWQQIRLAFCVVEACAHSGVGGAAPSTKWSWVVYHAQDDVLWQWLGAVGFERRSRA